MHTKFYMHHVKTCKKCQKTYKNTWNVYESSTRAGKKMEFFIIQTLIEDLLLKILNIFGIEA